MIMEADYIIIGSGSAGSAMAYRLTEDGKHSVIVIEHQLDLIAEADYLVEVGPEGGEAGGQILYQGPPSGLLAVDRSPTRPFLYGILS